MAIAFLPSCKAEPPPPQAAAIAPLDAAAHADVPDESEPPLRAEPRCPPEMALVAHAFCIDRWEAHLVAIGEGGAARARSPFLFVQPGEIVEARSEPGVFPSAYLSQVQAARACANAGKRLCTADEFGQACRGPEGDVNQYPYGGTSKRPGACNEGKGSAVAAVYGPDAGAWTYAEFNDPKLNQRPGGLAKTGAFEACVSPWGVYDLVGNVHEWGADGMDERGHGRFRGGFYGDAEVNGHGCAYVTKAHEPTYHDYSTGFRCCMDPLESGE